MIAVPEVFDDRLALRNTRLLSFAQALYGSAVAVLMTTGGLVGHMLADDKALATLPISTFVIGTASLTVPASLFMRRVGRRTGFMVGTLCGVVGCTLAAYAILIQSFALFTLSTFLVGGYQSFALYYRFAATDTASPGFRPKAIAYVLAGGVVAAIFGPQVVIWTKDLLAPVLFAGCFVAAAGLSLVATVIVSFVDIPKPPSSGGGSGRPLAVILRQPRLIVAVFCGMTSYAMMNLVMTASPLAMVQCGFGVDAAAHVIQWHIVAMYLPSFFTGHLIARWGKEPIIAAGLLMLGGCGLVALAGIELHHFGIALVLLGIGWNFGFVGATALVTDCYEPSERNKVQAVNDFSVFAMVALSSLSSGSLLHHFGWDAVALAVFPVVGIALASVFALGLASRRARMA